MTPEEELQRQIALVDAQNDLTRRVMADVEAYCRAENRKIRTRLRRAWRALRGR